MGNTCNTNCSQNCSQNPPTINENMERLPVENHHSLESVKVPMITVESTYDQIGGRKALYAAIDSLYDKVLKDPQISHYFKYVDMNRLKDCMKNFQVYVAGGPFQYKGLDMRKAHESWGIKPEHFNIMKRHYETSLLEEGIKFDAVQEIISAFECQRDSVLNKASIYDRLGGEPAINATIDLFYKKLLAIPETGFFFRNTNMIRQAEQQKKFQMMILGGPNLYTGKKSMADAHRGLGISNEIFDQTKKCLEDAMTDLGVPRGLIVEVILNFENYRNDVVEESKSLYSRVGGKASVTALVNLFYKKVKVDPNLNIYFKNTDMGAQNERLKKFLTFVLGGPNEYKGLDMKTAHARMGINDIVYSHMKTVFESSLVELNVEGSLIIECCEVFESFRESVLDRKTLFERLGGKTRIESAIQIFYKKLLSSGPELSKFYKGIDIDALQEKMTLFVTIASGGPGSYLGKDMHTAHAPFQISDDVYDKVKEIFVEAFMFSGVNEMLCKEMSILFESQRKLIVMKKSLYERIGGAHVLRAAVELFYSKMTGDPRVAHFFDHIDMDKLRDSQFKFLSKVLQGPNEYKGRNMQEAHEGWNITHEDFNVTVDHMKDTLIEKGVDKEIISEIALLLESTRSQIVIDKSKK